MQNFLQKKLENINYFKKYLVEEFKGDDMSISSPDVGMWKAYCYLGVLLGGFLLMFFGGLRASDIIYPRNAEYWCWAVAVVGSLVDYYLIPKCSKWEIIISILIGMCLIVTVYYLILDMIVICFGIGINLGWIEIILGFVLGILGMVWFVLSN